MENDHWLTHARGGRRWFLKLTGVGTFVAGVASSAGWDALKWGWQAFTARVPSIVGAGGIAAGRATVVGVGNVTLAPLTGSITATGYAPKIEIAPTDEQNV